MKLAFWRKKTVPIPIDKDAIIGVTLGWDARPHLCFGDRKYLPEDIEKKLYPQYFKNGVWPCDPETGEKLPIAYP